MVIRHVAFYEERCLDLVRKRFLRTIIPRTGGTGKACRRYHRHSGHACGDGDGLIGETMPPKNFTVSFSGSDALKLFGNPDFDQRLLHVVGYEDEVIAGILLTPPADWFD